MYNLLPILNLEISAVIKSGKSAGNAFTFNLRFVKRKEPPFKIAEDEGEY